MGDGAVAHEPATTAPREVHHEPATTAPREAHRWRDLDVRDRRWGAAVAVALLLAPLVALAVHLPDWSPQADPALMALRSLDSGTGRTPLIGQPSQSGVYAESAAPVHHPGPLHFYLMALPVRVVGGTLGMLTVSVLITGTCLLTAAWAVFRQLGRSAGVVAALGLAAVTFTTGTSSLVNPVSSSIAGYPLLLSAVLLWCVAAGDLRLMPAAAAAASFTAQQHLSVVPATAVLTVGALVVLATSWWREGRWRDATERRDLARWSAWSGVVCLALWSPVLVQQALGRTGNLGQMVWFARHGDRVDLGYTSAVWQLAHTLGLPPLLGRTEVTGHWLISRPSPTTWASAVATVALVTWLSVRWRATYPRRATLGAMVGVTALAGLVNGSSVPVGIEQGRLSFYHWAFVLAFLVVLVLGLAVTDPVQRALDGRHPAAIPAAVGFAVCAIAAPTVANSLLDRTTDTAAAANAYLDPDVVDHLADGAHAQVDRLGDHPLLIAREVPPFHMYADTLAFALVERGIDIRFPLGARHFVHEDRLVERDEVDVGLVLVVDDETPGPTPAGGELVAEAALPTVLDLDAYRSLVEAVASTDEVVLGATVEGRLSDDEQALATSALVAALDDPEAGMLRPDVVGFLADHPDLEQPALDSGQVERLHQSLAGLDDDWRPGRTTGLRLYLVDREEMLRFATEREIGSSRG